MQQIERYGVIALVFLLVTIVAVSFWGDSKSPGFWSRLTGRGGANKTEIAKNSATAERAVDNALPLTSNPAPTGIDTAPQAQPVPGAPVAQGAPGVAQPLAPTAQSAMANANAPANNAPAFGANGAVHLPGNAPQPNNAAPAQSPFIATAQPTATPQASEQVAHKAQKTAAPTGPTIEYVVQKGDSLASIAQKNLGSSSRWTEIQSLNGGIQPKALRVGTKLKLPITATAKSTTEKSAPKPEPAATKKPAPSSSETQPGTVYVVHAGDTLRTIAEKKLGNADRWKDIVAANPGLDAHKLVVGKSLKMPAAESHDNHALVAAAMPASSGAPGKPRVR
jgi:nucleoid-associated protein YgaU